MADAPARAVAGFRAAFAHDPACLVRAPGRINLIGEHVDYSEGFVLPAAIDRLVAVAASPLPGSRAIHAHAPDLAEQDQVDPAAPVEILPGWRGYLRGVVAELHAAGVTLPGVELAFAGDVPQGAGLSSSAALEVGFALALLHAAGVTRSPEQVARLCRRAEVEQVGVACGIMDQFAALFGRAGHAILLDCRSLEWRAVPFPEGSVLVVADSGTRRRLGHTAFNARFAECREAARLLDVPALRDVPPDALDQRLAPLPAPLRRRARHVVRESARTLRTADLLARGALAEAGQEMNASHAGLRDDYEVSTPELDALVAAARAVPGVYGSRMSGGGFGGCTISLLEAAALPGFLAEVPAAYRRATGLAASAYPVIPSRGAWVERREGASP